MDMSSRFLVVRDVVSVLARDRRYKPPSPTGSVLAPIEPRPFLREMRADGFGLGLALSPQLVEQLVEFALFGVCYGNSDPNFGFRYADHAHAEAATGRPFSLGTYLFTDEVSQVIERIANDPLLRNLVGGYLGKSPVYLGRRLWWTFAKSEAEYDAKTTTSFFHYDRDDYRAVRVFFYLTTVDTQHGPHVVVRGSHRNKTLPQLFSAKARSDVSIERYYGADNLVTIEGCGGTGFVEDTFCFHKATRPIAGDRLMLELGFGLRNHRIFPPPDRSRASLITLAR